MMQRLMRKLVRDVKNCSENAVLALRVIHQHYIHFKKYYGVPGHGATVHGLANSEEKHMTMTTFAILIDILHKQVFRTPRLSFLVLYLLSRLVWTVSFSVLHLTVCLLWLVPYRLTIHYIEICTNI